MKKTIIVTREADHIEVVNEDPYFEAYWLMFGHIMGTDEEVTIQFPHVSNFSEDEVFQDPNEDTSDLSATFDWEHFQVFQDRELVGDETVFDYIQREETLRQIQNKTFTVKPEYIDEWGTYAEEGTTLKAGELVRLADEWGKDVEELLEQLDEVSSKTRLQAVQEKLQLNQKQLGIYIGVSTRAINAWMGKAGTRECADYIVEMAERLAEVDARALENDEPTTTMMRWAVIDEREHDTFLTVCGDRADALREAAVDWDHLTAFEKEHDVVHFSVGLIRVQLTEENGKRSFQQALLPGSQWVDGDVYEVAKSWK